MAVAFVAAGTVAAGTTSVAPTYPATVDAGQLAICLIASKYPAAPPTVPSGWAQVGQAQGGAGASGADSGQALVTVLARLTDGSEDGATVNITITGGNSAVARIFTYSKAAGAAFALSFFAGADSSQDVSWSATASDDPQFLAGDIALAVSAQNTDAAAFSAPSLTAAGATFGASNTRTNSTTGQGDDCRLVAIEFPVSAGQSTGVPTFTATGAAATAGVTGFLRLREVAPATGIAAGAATAAGVASASPQATGLAAGAATVSGAASAAPSASGAAAGVATVSGIADADATATGLAAGLATVAGVADLDVQAATGIAAGTATVAGVASAEADATGLAAGSSSTVGAAAAVAEGTGIAAGLAAVAGLAAAIAEATGLAAGLATVRGFAPISGIVADDPIAEGRLGAGDVTIHGRLSAAELEVQR